MKYGILIYLLCLFDVLALISCSYNQQIHQKRINKLNSIQNIEGINYVDHIPISVEVKNGIITKISKLSELTLKNKPYFIAPGLIDIQVNG